MSTAETQNKASDTPEQNADPQNKPRNPEEFKQTPHERAAEILAFAQQSLELALSEAASPELAKVKRLVGQAQELIDGYDPYVAKFSNPAPAIVEKIWNAGFEQNWAQLFQERKTSYRMLPEMSAGGYEGVLLSHLARLSQSKDILEIGMFTGTTTVSLALVPSVEKVVALEIEPYLVEFSRPYFQEAGVADKIDVRLGKALDSLEILEAEGASFDMVFIDADKPSYLNYLDRILASPTLLTKGGFIAADNVVWKGGPWAPYEPWVQGIVHKFTKEVHEFNIAVHNRTDIDVVMLPVEDGISLIRRKGE